MGGGLKGCRFCSRFAFWAVWLSIFWVFGCTTTTSKPRLLTSPHLLSNPPQRTRVERARKDLTCNAWFGLGVPELVVIAGDAALVFGPKKLPEVGKSIGKTVKSFQQDAPLIEQSPALPKSSTASHQPRRL
ncbi:sec-independent protein translocase protein TATA, chloroplastic-like [Quercus robur]|uniref:sec-independent protein translocase protein TATA, chloroplastic-like n=1 Tax=Quercus robur TaxID=38942 RepID=UPI0021630501|nr:sec-independent protein translocase protein TATA, chloroplastic-like [Quercus robur]